MAFVSERQSKPLFVNNPERHHKAGTHITKDEQSPIPLPRTRGNRSYKDAVDNPEKLNGHPRHVQRQDPGYQPAA